MIFGDFIILLTRRDVLTLQFDRKGAARFFIFKKQKALRFSWPA
jgi:hypothetical protein